MFDMGNSMGSLQNDSRMSDDVDGLGGKKKRTSSAKARTSKTPTESLDNDTLVDKLVKKQQRMQRNRESASLSRQRRKEYMASLETRYNQLVSDHQKDQLSIQRLTAENEALRRENQQLREALKPTAGYAKPVAATASVLMVCFLCFGLFNSASLGTVSNRGEMALSAPVSMRAGRSLQSVRPQSTELALSSLPMTPREVPKLEPLPAVPPKMMFNETEFALWIQQRVKDEMVKEDGLIKTIASDNTQVALAEASPLEVCHCSACVLRGSRSLCSSPHCGLTISTAR